MSNSRRGKDARVLQDAPGATTEGVRRPMTGFGGTMIMKSVSLFLANGRRASKSGIGGGRNRLRDNMTMDVGDGLQPRRRKSQAMFEDLSGKINPKLIEMYKKKTHFSK